MADTSAQKQTGTQQTGTQTKQIARTEPRFFEHAPPTRNYSTLPFWLGVGCSAGWLALVLLVLISAGAAKSFAGIPLTSWALGLSAVVSPVAFIWMVAAYLQRAADVQTATEPLRRQLGMILNEQGSAEARIKRFNLAVRQQLILLKNASKLGQTEIGALLEKLQTEKSDIVDLLERSKGNVGRAGEVVAAAKDFDRLIEERLENLRALDGSLTQTGDALGRNTASVREQLEQLLSDIDTQSTQITKAITSANENGAQLRDAIRNQETDLLAAADNASAKLAESTRAVELQIEQFYDKAQDARGEAVRAADLLSTQGDRIAELASALPRRVEEAEATLRAAAERLAETESEASQQAGRLGATLTAQADQIHNLLTSFSGRIEEADGNLLQRRGQLESLVNHIAATTETLTDILGKSVDKFDGTTNAGIERLRDITTGIRDEAARLNEQVSEATGRYEGAAERVRDLTENSNARLGETGDKLSRMILQLEAIDEHARSTGRDVSDRANAAVGSMEEFQDKLAGLRDKVTELADHTVDRFSQGATQNQQVIARLAEVAQNGVQSLSLATEALARHEDTLADRAREAEQGLRDVLVQLSDRTSQSENNFRLQVAGITNLLGETESRLDETGNRLAQLSGAGLEPVSKALARIIDTTQQGSEQLADYQRGLDSAAQKMLQTTDRTADLSMTIDHSAVTALQTVDTLFGRLGSIQAAQQGALADTHRAFDEMSARLKDEITGFNRGADETVVKLRTVGGQVSEQVTQLTQVAQQGAAQLQSVTGTLQNDAAHTRALMQKQTADLIGDLSQAQATFNGVGDTVKERAGEAYGLIERVATRFQDVTQNIAQAIEEKVLAIRASIDRSNAETGALETTLDTRISLIDRSNERLQEIGTAISASSNRVVTQLQTISDRSERAHETVANSVSQSLNRLDEANMALQRHTGTINEGAQTATASLQKAGTAMAEQGTRLLDLTSKSDQQLRSLAGSASSLAEHTAQIRIAMEQQSAHLVQQLNGAVGKLQETSKQLQQTVETALSGAEQSSGRFDEMSAKIGSNLGAGAEQLQRLTRDAESALSAISGNLNSQLNALEQAALKIAEQQTSVRTANDNQKEELVAMFERLGMAHASSSEAAERTAGRLSETLSAMNRQLAQFNEQTQSSLAAVRTTGAGFADQAGTLTTSAQQAEQQVRAVLSVTASLADQAQKIREQTQTETARAAETLATMLGQIDGSGERLKIQTANVLASIDQASARFASSTRDASGMLVEQTGELSQLAARATEALSGYGTQLREQQEQLASVEGEAAKRTQSIASVAQQASQRLSELNSQLLQSESNAGETTAEMIERIGAVRAAVQRDLQELTHQAELAAGQAATASQRIGEAESRLQSTAERLRGEGERIPAIIGNSVSQMEATTTHLRQHAEQVAKTLGSSTTLFSETAHAANGVLGQLGLRVKAAAEEAKESITYFAKLMAEQVDAMQDGTGNFSAEQQKLLQQANATVAEVLLAGERLTSLRESAETAATKFGVQLQNLDVQASVVSERLGGSSVALQQQIGLLAEATKRSESQIQTATAGSREQMDKVRTMLQAEVTSINNGFAQMATQLEDMYAGIKKATSGTFEDIEQMAGRFRAASEGGVDLMARKTLDLRALTEQAAELLNGFGKQLDNQLDRLTVTTEQIAAQDGKIGSDITKALKHFEGVGKQLEINRDLLSNMGEQITRRMADISNNTEDQIRNLAEQAEAAANMVRNATSTWEETTESLARGAISARGEVVSVSHAMDALQEKASTMRGTLQQQGEQLITSLAQLIAQLESAGDSMQYSADPLVNKIENSLKKIS
ncbi:MAG: hypothetical protein GC131_07345 [Alphaproteobacteria bacterium]|nr:hypothetical protein [Alphaproteobacteria bacterium]